MNILTARKTRYPFYWSIGFFIVTMILMLMSITDSQVHILHPMNLFVVLFVALMSTGMNYFLRFFIVVPEIKRIDLVDEKLVVTTHKNKQQVIDPKEVQSWSLDLMNVHFFMKDKRITFMISENREKLRSFCSKNMKNKNLGGTSLNYALLFFAAISGFWGQAFFSSKFMFTWSLLDIAGVSSIICCIFLGYKLNKKNQKIFTKAERKLPANISRPKIILLVALVALSLFFESQKQTTTTDVGTPSTERKPASP